MVKEIMEYLLKKYNDSLKSLLIEFFLELKKIIVVRIQHEIYPLNTYQVYNMLSLTSGTMLYSESL